MHYQLTPGRAFPRPCFSHRHTRPLPAPLAPLLPRVRVDRSAAKCRIACWARPRRRLCDESIQYPLRRTPL